MIELKQVGKVYQTDTASTCAVGNVSLSIASGEFVSLVGPSGCGKSTLLGLVGFATFPLMPPRLLDTYDAERTYAAYRALLDSGAAIRLPYTALIRKRIHGLDPARLSSARSVSSCLPAG